MAALASESDVSPSPEAEPWDALDLDGEDTPRRARALAEWFAAGLGVRRPSLASLRLWDLPRASHGSSEPSDEPPEPLVPWKPKSLGSLLHVQEPGWGAVPEIFRAYGAWRLRRNPPKRKSKSKVPKDSKCDLGPLGPLVTLRFLKRLLPNEILAFPHSFKEEEGHTWHLVALLCHSTRKEESRDSRHVSARRRTLTFLHGAKEWVLDGAQMHEVHRWQLPGSVPNAWLCTRDLTPLLAVYSTHSPRGHLPAPVRSRLPAIPAGWLQADSDHLNVRIVTEKMLQTTRGSFAGGYEVPASAELKLPMAASLEDLKQQVHQTLRIPAERQLLFQIPDCTPASGSSCPWLVPVRSPLSTLLPLAVAHGMRIMPTVLLMFQSNDVDPASISSMLGWRVPEDDTTGEGEPDRIPLLCRYFQADTLSHSVLGVLLCSPADRLQEHQPWLQKRISTLPQPGSQAGESFGGPGPFGPSPPLALAASVGPGPGREPSVNPFKPVFLRMDRPLKEQSPPQRKSTKAGSLGKTARLRFLYWSGPGATRRESASEQPWIWKPTPGWSRAINTCGAAMTHVFYCRLQVQERETWTCTSRRVS